MTDYQRLEIGDTIGEIKMALDKAEAAETGLEELFTSKVDRCILMEYLDHYYTLFNIILDYRVQASRLLEALDRAFEAL